MSAIDLESGHARKATYVSDDRVAVVRGHKVLHLGRTSLAELVATDEVRRNVEFACVGAGGAIGMTIDLWSSSCCVGHYGKNARLRVFVQCANRHEMEMQRRRFLYKCNGEVLRGYSR